MSATLHINQSELAAPPVMATLGQRSLVIGLVFVVVCAFGAFTSPHTFYSAYLTAYMDWLGVTLGCMVILMLQHMTGGAWGLVIRRVMEAAVGTLPLMAVLFIPVVLGIPYLYAWAQPQALAKDVPLQQIAHSYLNAGGFVTRAVIYFALWGAIAFFLLRWSAEQDTSSQHSTLRFRVVSGPGILIYALTISFASVDWVMSLQARWVSTIYGMMFIAGQVLAGFCFVVVMETILSKRKPMSEYLHPKEIHDHGKLILAFVMVWAYFNFSQWLIIWNGNLPDEIPWYLRRLNGGWAAVGLALVIFHFVAPFVMLLGRQFKRRTRTMVWIAAMLLVMRYVDLWWNIEPVFSPTIRVTLWTIACPLAIGGIWLWLFARNLRQRPLLPLYAPHVRELLEPAHE